MNRTPITLCGTAMLLCIVVLPSVAADYRGQLSAWTSLSDEEAELQVGGRYIAELSADAALSDTWDLSAEAAAAISPMSIDSTVAWITPEGGRILMSYPGTCTQASPFSQ